MSYLNQTLLLALAVLFAIGMEVLYLQRPTWLRLFWLESRWKLSEWSGRLQMGVAFCLPRWLVFYAAIRLVSHATTGRYGCTVVPTLTLFDALDRWSQPNE